MTTFESTILTFVIGAVVLNSLIYGGIALTYFLDKRPKTVGEAQVQSVPESLELASRAQGISASEALESWRNVRRAA